MLAGRLNFGWSWTSGGSAETKSPSTRRDPRGPCLPLYLFTLPFSSLIDDHPVSWLPAACSHAEPASSGSSPAPWLITIPTPSLSKHHRALSPGLSRLGQYRKRLTCTLTRIHGATCSLHQYTPQWGPSNNLWHKPIVYRHRNAVRHETATQSWLYI